MKLSEYTIKQIAGVILAYFLCNLLTYIFHYQHENFLLTYWFAVVYYGFSAPLSIYIISFLGLSCALFPLFLLIQDGSKRYGYAENASSADLKKMQLLSKTGLLLGAAFGQEVRYDKPLSTLCLAPPGTGKTSSLLIPNLLSIQNSVIVHDPKGELVRYTSRFRATFSDVIFFDPVSPNSDIFNPLDVTLVKNKNGAIDEAKARPLLQNVASIIISDSKDGDSYWIKAARSLFVFAGMWLYWHDGEASISGIKALIFSRPKFDEVIEIMMSGNDPRRSRDVKAPQNRDDVASKTKLENELNSLLELPEHLRNKNKQERIVELKEQLALFNEKRDRKIPDHLIQDINSLSTLTDGKAQMTGVVGSIEPDLQIFSDPNIAKATTGSSSFSEKSLRTTKQTVYIVVRDQDKDRLKGLIGLVLNSIAKQLLSREPKDEEEKVTFCVDEFPRLGRVEALSNMPELSRGYNVNSLFIAQSYAQISSIYGRDYIRSFNQSCAYKVIFRQNELESAESISKTIGNRTDTRKSINKDLTKLAETQRSASESEEGISHITAQDILSLKTGEVIIMAEGFYHKPIRGKSVHWESVKPYSDLKKEYAYERGTDLNKIYTEVKAHET